MSTHRIECTVNGESHSLEVPSRRLLSDFLRDDLHLTGTKRGCETGVCGACSVLLDGEVVKSCLMLAVQVRGRSITTIEGLGAKGDHPLQKAWKECNVPQCGYCQSGQIMQAASMLKKTPKPTDAQIDSAMQGNICRCGTYQRIRQAVKLAAGVKA